MDAFIQQINAALRDGEPIALSMIVRRRGSLPMGQRARLLVRSNGTAQGTIGGGCLEADVYARASEVLRGGGASVDRFDLTEVEDGLEGHICGGSVSVLTQALYPEPGTVALFARLHEVVEHRQAAILATRLPADDAVADATIPSHVLLLPDGEVLCAPQGPVPPGFVERCLETLSSDQPTVVGWAEESGEQFFVEPLVPRPTAVVFGAGHCGVAIGKLAAASGFRVLVLDDREPFLDTERMPWADVIECIDFDHALAAIEVGSDPYFLIVTRGHEHDLTVLRQLLDRSSSYLGMIGSERKKLMFLRTLTEEGVAPETLARLRSPMGLAIGADTPEEIAVAVVAEMIAVRRDADLGALRNPGRRRTLAR